MLRLKSCPRCHGDVVRDKDQYGGFEQCLQCGYLRDIDLSVIELPEKQEEAGEAA